MGDISPLNVTVTSAMSPTELVRSMTSGQIINDSDDGLIWIGSSPSLVKGLGIPLQPQSAMTVTQDTDVWGILDDPTKPVHVIIGDISDWSPAPVKNVTITGPVTAEITGPVDVTPTAGATFDVAGDVGISGDVSITPAAGSTFNITGAVDINGTVPISGSVDISAGEIDATITGPVSITGDPQITTGWRGTPFVNQSVVVGATSNHAFGPFDCTGFGSLYIGVSDMSNGAGSASGCSVTVIQSDSTGLVSTSVEQYQLYAPNGGGTQVLSVVIPLTSDSVTITVGGNGSITCQTQIEAIPINISTNSVVYPIADNQISVINSAVSANSNVFLWLPSIQPGQAYLSFQPVGTGAAGKMDYSINAVDSTGASNTPLVPRHTPASFETQTIIIPPRVINLHVFNTDTVSHQFSACLIPGGPT